MNWDAIYPRAKHRVDGRLVRSNVPNRSSIGASVENYKILPGLREVSLSLFEAPPERSQRTIALAEAIEESREINPLIVVVDKEGPYILEGAHRYDALKLIGAASFPALVVIDLDSLGA